MKSLSFRSWVSIATLLLLGVILFVSRAELHQAWEMLGRINAWVLVLFVPISVISYFASGEIIFSYLRQKKMVQQVNPFALMRLSLELNFVNHVLPSGGVSGISYMNWRLGKYGVSSGRATMAQAVRYAVGFAAITTLLAISVLLVTIDGNINRWIVLMSSTIVFIMVFSTTAVIYLIGSPSRTDSFSGWLSSYVNRLLQRITFGRVRNVIDCDKIKNYFDDVHEDYIEIRHDKRLLIKPFLWALLYTVAEVALFYITFLALGSVVNPAPILIAYGVASVAGFIFVTPGGTGVYETIMVIILAMAGLNQSEAIAGIVLSRVMILVVTIGLGYVFYQLSLIQYGKRPNTTT